jgi:hypothetical protein
MEGREFVLEEERNSYDDGSEYVFDSTDSSNVCGWKTTETVYHQHPRIDPIRGLYFVCLIDLLILLVSSSRSYLKGLLSR